MVFYVFLVDWARQVRHENFLVKVVIVVATSCFAVGVCGVVAVDEPPLDAMLLDGQYLHHCLPEGEGNKPVPPLLASCLPDYPNLVDLSKLGKVPLQF